MAVSDDPLAVIEDDGAAKHLPGTRWPDLDLPATNGTMANLSRVMGRTVLFAYPQSEPPGPERLDGPDSTTPQLSAFRDHFTELKDAGIDRLFGLSTQETADQRGIVARLHLPFPLLSDARLKITHMLQLPTIEVDGTILLKRVTLVIDHGVIRFVFYPVFPAAENALAVLAWVQASRWGNKTLFHLNRKGRMAAWLRYAIAALRR